MNRGTQVAGRYVIESKLASGGMGDVYVALDEKFGVRVALKISSAGGGSFEDFKQRFSREARLGNRLGKFAGFVRAFDWGEVEGEERLYLAMDLVPGARPLDLRSGSLEERLARLASAARLVVRAHQEGVIHRDLKPQNFLQAEDEALWLTDFGVAKLKDQADTEAQPDRSPGLTRSGMALGTATYMPPEQFEDVKHVDERADVYALGVMLFIALTGRPPFQGSTMSIVQQQVMVSSGSEPPPHPAQFQPDVPSALDWLCLRALAVKPEERLPSASEFVKGLEAFLGQPSKSRPSPAPAPPTGPPRPRGVFQPSAAPTPRQAVRPVTVVAPGPGLAPVPVPVPAPVPAKVGASPSVPVPVPAPLPAPAAAPVRRSSLHLLARVVALGLSLVLLGGVALVALGVWLESDAAQSPVYLLGLQRAHDSAALRAALGGDFLPPAWTDRSIRLMGEGEGETVEVSATLTGPAGSHGTLTFHIHGNADNGTIETERFTDSKGRSIDLSRPR